jgi:branched-chain amino acid aminotransferase
MLLDPSNNNLSAGAVFADGAITPLGSGSVPLMDWGFLHSSACQDTVSVWRGNFFCLDRHMERFMTSCAALRLVCPYEPAQIVDILCDLVSATGLAEAYVQMIVTRGIPLPGSRDPRTCRNRFMAFCLPYVNIVPADRQAISAFVSRRERISSSSVPSQIKNYHWIDFELGLFEAYEHGCDTVILSSPRGGVSEGPGFNVFVVRDGMVTTPGENVLRGVTREVVFELCRDGAIPLVEAKVTLADLTQADEVFGSSTAGGIFPIEKINEYEIANSPGKITAMLIKEYWERRASAWHGTPVKARLKPA